MRSFFRRRRSNALALRRIAVVSLRERWFARVLFPLVMGLWASSLMGAEGKPEAPPWARRPYQLLAAVGFSADPEFTSEFRRSVRTELESAGRRHFRACWNLAVGEAGAEDPNSVEELNRLSLEDGRFRKAEHDQRFWIAVHRSGSRYLVSARTWHAATNELGPVVTTETFDRDGVAPLACETLRQLFQPLLEIENVADESVTLTLRAGELIPEGIEAANVQSGDILLPFFRYVDRHGAVQRVQMIPWTYLTVNESRLGKATAVLATGVRSSLGSNKRRNVELLAIRMRPQTSSTTLTLTPRGFSQRPLVAHPVIVTDIRPGAVAENAPAPKTLARSLSDRSGQVKIDRDPQHPLVWIQVFSGDQLLARVPFVPGQASAMDLELPDDSLRLTVEGELQLLEGRLVDAVARRATMAARLRRLARESDWKSVDALLVEFEKLPGISEFEKQLNAVRAPAIEAAQQKKDRVAETRIQQMTADARQLIGRYLNADRETALREELNELRQLDKTNQEKANAASGK